LVIVFLSVVSMQTCAEESWTCSHPDHEREDLIFTPLSDGNVKWEHQKLGELDKLRIVVNSDGMLTMATQRLNVLYSRFFHLEKFSGRMGETTFRASILRRLKEKDDTLKFDSVTTVWSCESNQSNLISESK